MSLSIYHNPRCRKSRETLQIVHSSGINYEIIEYLKDVPTATELKSIVHKLGIEPYDLIRRGEAVFKEKYKGNDPKTTDWIAVMVENPKLIERPIVVRGEKAIIGRPPETVKELL